MTWFWKYVALIALEPQRMPPLPCFPSICISHIYVKKENQIVEQAHLWSKISTYEVRETFLWTYNNTMVKDNKTIQQNLLTWIKNTTEDALWYDSSYFPSFYAKIHKSVVSLLVSSTKHCTSELRQTSTCIFH